jgi:glycerol kinase
MPELLLAIDIGTSSARAALFTPAGELAILAKTPLSFRSPHPGWVEQDAAAVVDAALASVRAALSAAGRTAADLAAIGVTTQRASAVFWDRATGAPVTPLVIWSDLRGVERAAELGAEGFIVSPQMASAKVEQMLAAAPDAVGLMAQGRLCFGNIDSYLIFRLSGGAAHVTDRSQGWPLGYLSLADFGWNQALIERQGMTAAVMPTLCDTWGEIAVSDPAVLGAAIPICADVADQQSALMGHGDAEGVAKVSYGTSATLNLSTGGAFVYRDRSVPPFVLSSVGGDTRFCLEGMVYTAGAALDWLRAACGLGDVANLEALAASVPDTAGAVFLPALQGLGAPHADLARRGLIGGLSTAVNQAHLARAGLEGLAARVREAFDHLYAVSQIPPPDALRTDGGLTSNATFMQIQADLLGRPVMRHAAQEATASGAALCAGKGCGLLTDTDAAGFARYDRIWEPKVTVDTAEARYQAWLAAVYG